MRPATHVFQLYRTAGEDQVWWRYISANGRGIARCPEPMSSLAAAQNAIARVRHCAEEAEIVIKPAAQNRWRWILTLGDEVVARGSGDHDRRVRCSHAAERFVETVAGAVIDEAVHVFRRRDLAGRSTEAL